MTGPNPSLRPTPSAPGRHARPGAPPVLRRALVAAGLAIAALLAVGSASAEADDRVATAWQEQAGTAPLLQAPRPANPATICIIDTGVTPTPDLEITKRRSLLGGTLDDVWAAPGSPGHGTAVAHFAAGKVNGWGGAGAFPHARVTSVRIFPEGGGAAHWQDYVDALDHCQKLDARTKVILLSLGGQEIRPGEAAALENRIGRLRMDAGINIVVAAGNGGAAVDFPGRFSASFTVAAVERSGSLCEFSARGEGVDIAAPGCDLEQAGADGSLWRMSGSSFAAPIVAGALAALRSYDRRLGPDEAEKVLVSTGRRQGPIRVLDARAAMRAVGAGAVVDGYQAAPAPTGGSAEHVAVVSVPGITDTAPLPVVSGSVASVLVK